MIETLFLAIFILAVSIPGVIDMIKFLFSTDNEDQQGKIDNLTSALALQSSKLELINAAYSALCLSLAEGDVNKATELYHRYTSIGLTEIQRVQLEEVYKKS